MEHGYRYSRYQEQEGSAIVQGGTDQDEDKHRGTVQRVPRQCCILLCICLGLTEEQKGCRELGLLLDLDNG